MIVLGDVGITRCECGNVLPCTQCCLPCEMVLYDCACVAKSHQVVAGPEDSLKFDGMQRENYSVFSREFYLSMEGLPDRGLPIAFDGHIYRVQEVFQYGCDTCITAIRFFFPCVQVCQVYDCQLAKYCDEDNETTDLGQLTAHIFYGGFELTEEQSNQHLMRRTRIYPVGPVPFRWKSTHVLTCENEDGDTVAWRVIEEINAQMVERAVYLEVEQTDACCDLI